MKLRKSCALLATALGLVSVAKSQRLDSLLMRYESYQAEKIYFHLDRAAYGAGETIWFKGYLMRGILPSELSKTVYIDFSDANGKVFQHLAYPVQAIGATFGQVKLPDSIYTSSVHMRAYTKWMKNEDSAFFFNKTIKILNPILPKRKLQAPVLVKSLDVFPEGGHLVAGLSNVVAFKAHDQFGRPLDVKGNLVDSKGAKVASIKSVHDGFGKFEFIPKPGEKYTVNWSDGSSQNSASLPEVQLGGLTLHVQQDKNSGTYFISRTTNVAPEQKILHIVATLFQQVVYMANINLDEKSSVSGVVPTTDFPAGVITYTIFDKNWNPIAERIAYSQKTEESKYNAEVGFTKLGTGKRGINEIAVNVPDGLASTMSLSVTDNRIEKDSSDNIISSLLATSDLRGAVYHPRYYFSDTTATVREALDLVMLTHGWRKIDWKVVTTQQLPDIKFPADSMYMTLSGQIYGARPEQIRAAGQLFLFATAVDTSNGKNVQTRILDVHPDGFFIDSTGLFFDSLSVHYQFLSKPNFANQISIKFMPNRLPSPRDIPSGLGPFDYSFIADTAGDFMSRSLLNAYLSSIRPKEQLEEVVVKGRVKSTAELLEEKYVSGLFTGDGQFFDLVHDQMAASYMNIFQYLQARVAGLQISNPTSGNPTVTWRGGTPGFYLDEMPTDISMLQNLPVTDIAAIKILRPPFMGMGGANGGIAIYTRRGGEVAPNSNVQSKVKGSVVAGYSAIRTFYVPDYSKITDDFDKPDYRNTLYWNPMVATDNEHKMRTFQFYNNDVSSGFHVVLEGMAADGRVLHIEKDIE